MEIQLTPIILSSTSPGKKPMTIVHGLVNACRLKLNGKKLLAEAAERVHTRGATKVQTVL
jgi:hypothetical protein